MRAREFLNQALRKSGRRVPNYNEATYKYECPYCSKTWWDFLSAIECCYLSDT